MEISIPLCRSTTKRFCVRQPPRSVHRCPLCLGAVNASMQTEPGEPDLLPVRMLNEFVYCPRLFYFMHVEGKWEDNVYTLEGTEAHRRVDRKDQLLPDPKGDASQGADEGDPSPTIARSVTLSSSTF